MYVQAVKNQYSSAAYLGDTVMIVREWIIYTRISSIPYTTQKARTIGWQNGEDRTVGNKEYIVLRFSDNKWGQRRKVQALQMYSAEGWRIVSETSTPGERGNLFGDIWCGLAIIWWTTVAVFSLSTAVGMIPGLSLLLLPVILCNAGRDGTITVTLERELPSPSCCDNI